MIMKRKRKDDPLELPVIANYVCQRWQDFAKVTQHTIEAVVAREIRKFYRPLVTHLVCNLLSVLPQDTVLLPNDDIIEGAPAYCYDPSGVITIIGDEREILYCVNPKGQVTSYKIPPSLEFILINSARLSNGDLVVVGFSGVAENEVALLLLPVDGSKPQIICTYPDLAVEQMAESTFFDYFYALGRRVVFEIDSVVFMWECDGSGWKLVKRIQLKSALPRNVRSWHWDNRGSLDMLWMILPVEEGGCELWLCRFDDGEVVKLATFSINLVCIARYPFEANCSLAMSTDGQIYKVCKGSSEFECNWFCKAPADSTVLAMDNQRFQFLVIDKELNLFRIEL